MTVQIEKTWRRIGVMPPLAKMVMIDDEIVGRVLDITEYNEPGAPQPRDQQFAVQIWQDGKYSEAGKFESFDAAVARLKQTKAS